MRFALLRLYMGGKSVHADDILHFLATGEVFLAVLALRDFTARSWSEKSVGVELEDAPETFFHLLKRRGYFVGTPQEVAQTFQEIAGMGAGFDLFDLARAVAEYDMTLVECLKIRKRPLFPELRSFAVACPCGAHGERSR